MYDLKLEKSNLRKKSLEIRRAIPRGEKEALDRRICLNIAGSASYKYYDTILLYAALPDEPDLSELAVRALSDGKRIAYPRCIPGGRLMEFRCVSSLAELTPGRFGINEPSEDAPAFDPSVSSCSLCLVPAVSADKNGYRIGYGGGYYDRFLSSYSGTVCTVVYSALLTTSVPHGKYDLRADVIVTEGGINAVVKA